MTSDLGYREIPHTADLGLEIHGDSQAQFLTNAASGLCHLLACEPADDAVLWEHKVSLFSPDIETLLVAWLNELLYLCGEYRFCPERFDFHKVTDTELNASVYGRYPSSTHRLIKAATFHNLVVLCTSEGFHAQVTFDI
jgi:SHS2 domain-containing protein